MSDSNVVPVDFGKEDREAAARFARLFDMVQARNADILANPKKYLDQASEEICRLRRFIEEARDALRIEIDLSPYPTEVTFARVETIVVDPDEWRRHKRAAALLTDFKL